MDRRAALKKLAAGGAIALAGPTVLSSNMVAYAASGDPSSILKYDPSGDGATFTITGFEGGFFQWRLDFLSLTPAGKKQVDLVDGSGNLLFRSPRGRKVCGPCTPWTTSSQSLGTVRLERHTGLKPGDEFRLDVVVVAPNGDRSEYRITTRYGSPPSVEQLYPV
jgi:hypothetical protein